MNVQELKDASLFTHRMPQTHARGMTNRIAVGKALRLRTPRKLQATWAMAHLGRLMKEFHESVKCEPLDYVPEKAGTNG